MNATAVSYFLFSSLLFFHVLFLRGWCPAGWARDCKIRRRHPRFLGKFVTFALKLIRNCLFRFSLSLASLLFSSHLTFTGVLVATASHVHGVVGLKSEYLRLYGTKGIYTYKTNPKIRLFLCAPITPARERSATICFRIPCHPRLASRHKHRWPCPPPSALFVPVP